MGGGLCNVMKRKKIKKFFKNLLTTGEKCAIIKAQKQTTQKHHQKETEKKPMQKQQQYYFYIMGNAHKHIIKIGLTTDINRREYQIKKLENLHIISYFPCTCSDVDALLIESLLRKTMDNQGLEHYGLDHFKATVEQYKTVRANAEHILQISIDTYIKLYDLLK